MRILYVEDELKWHDVKRLFENTVFNKRINGKKMIEGLEAASKDKFGIDKHDIKKAIEKNFSDNLVVCYDFKDAMYHINHFSDSFDMFIVDRNLKYLDGIDIDGLKNLDPQFNQLFDDEMISIFSQEEIGYLKLLQGVSAISM